MRVSLINFNLIAKDAIGSCIIAQARFFLRRGDTVHIFAEQPPEGVPADIVSLCRTVNLAQLRQDRDGLFAATDVYIYHYGLYYSLMETITQLDGGLVTFYYHNVTPPQLWNWEEDRAVLRRGVEGVKLAAYADLVLSPSAFNLAEVAEKTGLPPERLAVLPLPVDTSAFCPGSAPEDLRRQYRLGDGPVLLYVGRMAHNKRIDLLVDLLAAVRRHPQHPQANTKLLLVGDHDSAPAYRLEVEQARERARTLGVEDGVIFAGRVDRLPDHYRLASVYVTTSQHEGFCVPLIEAMVSGVPIVAPASTAIPETLGDGGLLVPVNAEGVVDTAAMAEAVTRILTDPAVAAALRRRGLERVGEFTTERYNERLGQIIDAHCVNLPLRVQPAPHIQMAEVAAGASEEGLEWPELPAEALVAMPDYVVRSRLPLVGRLVVWVRRNLTSHLKEPYLDPIIQRQQTFNLRIAWVIDELTRRIQEQQSRQEEQQSRQDVFEAQLSELKRDLLRAESHAARLEERLTALRAAEPIPSGQPTPGPLEAASQAAYGFNYLRCNEAVGGAIADEVALYEQFVPLFEGRSSPILDLGCGRGAFLLVMQRHGIPAAGVDVDGDMVTYCREHGVEAEEDDIFDYLHRQADGSLGGIFCAHVIEHVPRTRLTELADLCWRKLEEGAALVWITPHGGSLSPLHATFYKDLTHTRPLHPDLLTFVLEANGFRSVETMTLSDMPAELKLQLLPEADMNEFSHTLNANLTRLNDLIFGHLDCAAIGRR